jgi:hypothetical protein
MKTNILLLLICAACEMASAQTPANPAQSIRELKDGVLVVRLRSQSNKIASLKEYIAKEPAGSPAASRLTAQLKETEEEVATENRLLVMAFRETYHFSEVLFVADTLAPRLKEQDTEGIFLDANLSPDPSLSIGQRLFLVAGMGTASYSDSAAGNDESLVVYDRNFNRMARPFPSYSSVTAISLLFKRIIRSEEEVRVFHYRKMVSRLDRKLNQYYLNVVSAGGG